MKIQLLCGLLLCCTGILFGTRAVAVPTDYNLTAAGSSATIGAPLKTATFTQSSFNPAGSGVIDSFVRLNTTTAQEQAYNTTKNNVYDNGNDNIHNKDITVGQVGFVATANGPVMRFLLDINEPNADKKSKLNLDEVQVFLSRNPSDDREDALGQGQLLALNNPRYLVYQMDAEGADNRVILDGDTGGGSGHGDMILDIPLTLFTDAFSAGGFGVDPLVQNGAYIYLYSRFGSNDNINDNNYEEWAAIKGNPIGEPPCTVNCTPQEVPEPGNLSLIAVGLFGAAVALRRRRGLR